MAFGFRFFQTPSGGFYIYPTASSRLGAKHSEESREKIRKVITDLMQFSDLK